MSAVPGEIDTDQQPPMTVPLRHFLVALILLLGAVSLALGTAIGFGSGFARIAYLHLLLVGWVCITIMGAMTQFVPVWAGTELHSRRLASVQLLLVTLGLLGMAGGFLATNFAILAVSGGLTLVGFWLFAYNIGRTILTQDTLDVTLQHFLVALGFLVAVPVFGVLLAVDFLHPIFTGSGVTHGGILGAHVSLAVFGIVLTTIYGALYQLATMFTQTDLHHGDVVLQRFETLAHPVGVVVLATGRLFALPWLASIGGVLVATTALAFASVILRKLSEMQVDWTPMHRRYAVAMAGLIAWALLAIPAWVVDPIARDRLLGAPELGQILLLGSIGFVILGTLYHIIPFIVWVHEYSDLLGFEQVPMIDDLYDGRLAAADLLLVCVGIMALLSAQVVALPSDVSVIAVGLVLAGLVAFTANMLLVLHTHGSHSLGAVLFGAVNPGRIFRTSPEVDDD